MGILSSIEVVKKFFLWYRLCFFCALKGDYFLIAIVKIEYFSYLCGDKDCKVVTSLQPRVEYKRAGRHVVSSI